MLYVKLMSSHILCHESRNKRELSAALEFGYKVFVISSDNSIEFAEKYPEYQLIPDGMDKLSYSIPRIKRYSMILRNWIRVIDIARNQQADVLSCHDLGSLLIGYLSNAFKPKSKKAKLIYDSHEFELGRNAKRNSLQKQGIKLLEGFLIRRCAFAIMVNDCIADEVQRIYRLRQRPVVVRSTPNLWSVDPGITAQMHRDYCRRLNVPEDSFLVMYHGGVIPGRGIEQIIKLLKINNNICAVILGNGEETYIDGLKREAKEHGVSARLLFLSAVPIEELWKYVGAADVGMATIPAVAQSYYYMLPNKFFENIQSETPVICSAFPAIKPIVEEHQIGLTCDPESIEEINRCVEKMRTDKAFYAQCKENLKKAKQELCWEKEKGKLINAYTYLD